MPLACSLGVSYVPFLLSVQCHRPHHDFTSASLHHIQFSNPASIPTSTKMRTFSNHAPRPTTGALCLPIPRPPMKRKGTDKEPPPDEAFSPDTSSDEDSDSDEDYIDKDCELRSLIQQNNKNMASPSPSSAHSPPARPSREAAKKASAMIATYQQDLPDGITDTTDLLSEALAPMKSEDKDAHKAWVELESDPVSVKPVKFLFPKHVVTDYYSTGLLQWCTQRPRRERRQGSGTVHREH